MSVTHTSKLMMHNHDNILSIFCLSSEVFVDDCVLSFKKLNDLTNVLLLKTCSFLTKFIRLNKK